MSVDTMLLVGGLLIIVGTASSKFSSRFGVPLLLLFISVGMLAGSEGIGGIHFADFHIAHGIATLSLSVILFDGGMRTSVAEVRPAMAPALVLATVGVLVTAAITGFAARMLLGVDLLPGLLLGSIVASTDAAAVFTVLRGSGLNLPKRLSSTLELESGLNDPMAVFLTIGLIELMLGRISGAGPFALLFVQEMLIGAVVGVGVGRLGVALINRMDLDAPGLYPVMTLAIGVFSFGLAAQLTGSGFLSVYLAGLCVGNAKITYHRGVMLFMDGAAWLAQITMFVLLGLLSFPTRVFGAAVPALLITTVLIFIARPLAAALSLLPFRFNGREVALVSWAGLKGAVPIVLAIYPLLFGLPGAARLFDVVFFVVLLSTAAQVWTLPLVARKLGLDMPGAPPAPVALEITSVRHLGGDIVDYPVTADSRAAGRRIRELMLPEDAVIAMIARGARVVPPRGSTRIEPGDHVFFVVEDKVRPMVDLLFATDPESVPEIPRDTEFPIAGNATVAELAEFYGIMIDAPAESTVADLLAERLGSRLAEGRGVHLGGLKVRVRQMQDDQVVQASIEISDDDASAAVRP